ncbi:MAG: zinc-dependent peptidase [Syntrophobacteraceae bacterium]|nr:zinc-dependent peptidase [Syntrophobacteraceae bacterium]
MLGVKNRRREKIRNCTFPPEWVETIEKNVPLYHRLPPPDQLELQGHILVFLDEKNFEGCGGLVLNDEIRVTIAAQACILLLHRKTDYYPGLYSILVYPGAFIAKGYVELAPGVYTETRQVHLGESWRHGALILSWDDVCAGASDIHDGHNVVLHEFAHRLDSEDGRANGAPSLPHRSMYVAWARILGSDFHKLQHDAQAGLPTVLDQYGAANPAEFFAVATECFFEKPVQLQSTHPELYENLKLYFRQDPARFASDDRLAPDRKRAQAAQPPVA